MEKKSGEDLKEPNVVLAFRTERAIIAGSNQSASQQADTKKTKGKGKKPQQASSNQSENVVEVSFVDKASLSKELNKMVNDLNDDLLEALVDHFLKSLNHQYFDLLKSKVESGLINSSMEEGGTSPVKGKNTIKEMQEKLKLFLINAKIFEKGVKTFPDPKTQDALNKHLIKTSFSDMVNDMVKFIANENMIQYKEESLNGDVCELVLFSEVFNRYQVNFYYKLNSFVRKSFRNLKIRKLERASTNFIWHLVAK
jgi:hypothetical protein